MEGRRRGEGEGRRGGVEGARAQANPDTPDIYCSFVLESRLLTHKDIQCNTHTCKIHEP